MPDAPLAADFFGSSAAEVARALLGHSLRSRCGGVETGGRIIETEAYLGVDDPASHAFAGRRHRGNLGIYSPPGYWYVYRSYGLHWCMNLVCGPPGSGQAVLIRAIMPEVGVAHQRARRGPRPDRILADGPGKLCQALGVTGSLDGQPMRDSEVVVIAAPPVPDSAVVTGPRVGISKAVEWPLRFRSRAG